MPEGYVFLAHIGHWACEVGVQYHSHAIALGSLNFSLVFFLGGTFFVLVFVFGEINYFVFACY